MPKTSTTAVAVAALLMAPMLSAAPAHAQSGNPLNSIFSCQSSGNKQAGGAAVGAVIGGLLGNSTSGKRNRGVNTVLGAAVGAAAGSYIGCRMQTSDQQRAEAAAQRALQYGENTSWTNPETGASGRINVVSSRPYDARPYDGGRNQGYQQPVNLRGVRFAAGVQPQRNYTGAAGEYEANSRVNLRGAPSTNAAIVGRLQAGESFDALARVRGSNGMDWLLVGNDRTAIGYVAESVVSPARQTYADNQYDRDQRSGGRASNQMCRTFDQTITTGSGDTETNRYTACQTPNGEWVVQA
jgi:surface antigen